MSLLSEPCSGRPLRIAVLRGDGIGPEVVEEGLKVLDAAAGLVGLRYELTEMPHGAAHHLTTGELIDEAALELIGEHDAVYFGAVGDPRVEPRVLERGVLFRITERYDMFISMRPYRLYAQQLTPLKDVQADNIDCVIVREAAEDIFALPGSSLRTGTPAEVSLGTVVFTRATVERVVRFGFELAVERAASRDRPGRVIVVDQSNAAAVFDIWPRVMNAVAPEFPDVEAEREAPDAFAMRLIKEPERYDVVITSWMLGGIFADMAAILVGGLGLSGSARISPIGPSLFEPTHGSAPKYAGAGVVSPVGAIDALRLLLEHTGHHKAARLIEGAVAEVLRSGRIPSVSARSGVDTRRQGDLIVEALAGRSA